MGSFIDQMDRRVILDESPKRIISIVPSQTQLFYYLGLEDRVVGITKFCIHPDEWFHSKVRVGGTKQLNLEKIKELKPDLIIGNKEENSLEDIRSLESIAPVWMSDIYTLEDAKEMIDMLGVILNKKDESNSLLNRIDTQFSLLAAQLVNYNANGKRALYFIWHEPDMVAGANTFINDMLVRCGLINFTSKTRYPEAPNNAQADYILLSSEPYPFAKKHLDYFKEKYPSSKIVFVDGEMFSWYGSKLAEAPAYFSSLLKQISS